MQGVADMAKPMVCVQYKGNYEFVTVNCRITV